ncbi:MAG: DUF5665 domain-containing protein [Patescibacteria group bacterium]|nr:hypothetical protein [Patescibacteria group bacterium]MBU2509350.1 hypothetical protein [Patescibacteria group bacterium]
MPTVKKTKNRDKDIVELSKQVGRVADALDKRNRFGRKLIMGLLFGIGTAVGASIIASIIVIIFFQIVGAVGLEKYLTSDPYKSVIEQQIKLQTPQE